MKEPLAAKRLGASSCGGVGGRAEMRLFLSRSVFERSTLELLQAVDDC